MAKMKKKDSENSRAREYKYPILHIWLRWINMKRSAAAAADSNARTDD
jgi:hypothetical protein